MNTFYLPQSTRYNSSKRELLLTYANGSKAQMSIETKNKKYFKFTLLLNSRVFHILLDNQGPAMKAIVDKRRSLEDIETLFIP